MSQVVCAGCGNPASPPILDFKCYSELIKQGERAGRETAFKELIQELRDQGGRLEDGAGKLNWINRLLAHLLWDLANGFENRFIP